MGRINMGCTELRIENPKKIFKENLQMESQFLLNVYFLNWKMKNPEFV